MNKYRIDLYINDCIVDYISNVYGWSRKEAWLEVCNSEKCKTYQKIAREKGYTLLWDATIEN
jgi:hypothetical protein